MIYFRDIPFGSKAAVLYAKELESYIDKKEEKIQQLEKEVERMTKENKELLEKLEVVKKESWEAKR